LYGHNDVSSYYIATGNLVLISHVVESCGCDAVLLETDISYGAAAPVFGTEVARDWCGHNFALGHLFLFPALPRSLYVYGWHAVVGMMTNQRAGAERLRKSSLALGFIQPPIQ